MEKERRADNLHRLSIVLDNRVEQLEHLLDRSAFSRRLEELPNEVRRLGLDEISVVEGFVEDLDLVCDAVSLEKTVESTLFRDFEAALRFTGNADG